MFGHVFPILVIVLPKHPFADKYDFMSYFSFIQRYCSFGKFFTNQYTFYLSSQPGGIFLGQPDGPQGGGCKAVVRHCGSPRSLHGFGHGAKETIPSPDRRNVGRLTGNSFLTMPAFCKN